MSNPNIPDNQSSLSIDKSGSLRIDMDEIRKIANGSRVAHQTTKDFPFLSRPSDFGTEEYIRGFNSVMNETVKTSHSQKKRVVKLRKVDRAASQIENPSKKSQIKIHFKGVMSNSKIAESFDKNNGYFMLSLNRGDSKRAQTSLEYSRQSVQGKQPSHEEQEEQEAKAQPLQMDDEAEDQGAGDLSDWD